MYLIQQSIHHSPLALNYMYYRLLLTNVLLEAPISRLANKHASFPPMAGSSKLEQTPHSVVTSHQGVVKHQYLLLPASHCAAPHAHLHTMHSCAHDGTLTQLPPPLPPTLLFTECKGTNSYCKYNYVQDLYKCIPCTILYEGHTQYMPCVHVQPTHRHLH